MTLRTFKLPTVFSITQLVDLCKSCILISYATRGLLVIVIKQRNFLVLLLFYSQINTSLSCTFTKLLPFLSDQLDDTKTIRPFAHSDLIIDQKEEGDLSGQNYQGEVWENLKPSLWGNKDPFWSNIKFHPENFAIIVFNFTAVKEKKLK